MLTCHELSQVLLELRNLSSLVIGDKDFPPGLFLAVSSSQITETRYSQKPKSPWELFHDGRFIATAPMGYALYEAGVRISHQLVPVDACGLISEGSIRDTSVIVFLASNSKDQVVLIQTLHRDEHGVITHLGEQVDPDRFTEDLLSAFYCGYSHKCKGVTLQ